MTVDLDVELGMLDPVKNAYERAPEEDMFSCHAVGTSSMVDVSSEYARIATGENLRVSSTVIDAVELLRAKADSDHDMLLEPRLNESCDIFGVVGGVEGACGYDRKRLPSVV